jgi:ankyrin repeat protein
MPPVYRVAMAHDGLFQSTPAHWAARGNRPDLILAMARSGVTADLLMRRDIRGLTPADIAAQNGSAQVIDALLQAGVPPAAFIVPGATHPMGCAGLAVRGNHHEVIQVLGHGGVDLTTQDGDGFNLIHLAVQENRPDMIESLGLALRLRGHPTAALMVANRHGYHAAALAALFDRPEAIRALLRAGVTPVELMAEGPPNSTCLHLAAGRGQARLVNTLAAAGVDLDTRDQEGWAAIHRAAQNNHAGVIGALFTARPACVNAAGPRGVTAAHLAVQGGRLAAIEALRAVGASFDLPDFDGRTARAMATMLDLPCALPPSTSAGRPGAAPGCTVM